MPFDHRADQQQAEHVPHHVGLFDMDELRGDQPPELELAQVLEAQAIVFELYDSDPSEPGSADLDRGVDAERDGGRTKQQRAPGNAARHRRRDNGLRFGHAGSPLQALPRCKRAGWGEREHLHAYAPARPRIADRRVRLWLFAGRFGPFAGWSGRQRARR